MHRVACLHFVSVTKIYPIFTLKKIYPTFQMLFYVLSVPFSSVTQSCPTLWSHRWQHARLPCPSPSPRAYSNSCPSNHLILCCRLLLPTSIFPSIRVFSNESVLPIRWPKYWNFSFSISPSSEYSGLYSFRMDWLDLLAVQGTLRVFFNTTVQKHQFFSAQPSLWSNSHIHTWLLEKP